MAHQTKARGSAQAVQKRASGAFSREHFGHGNGGPSPAPLFYCSVEGRRHGQRAGSRR